MRRVLAAALLLAGLAACDGAPRPAADAQAALARHEAGRKIYNFRCYYCHGYSGDAKTLAASFLSPPPRNFAALGPGELSREAMLDALEKGRPGTGMASFAGILGRQEMEQVVDFVRQEFMTAKAVNTRYHTAANGWPDHQRYQAAYPFATGALALDTPWEQLDAGQQAGKRLFLSACVSCHDRARVADEGAPWEGRPLSYPRNHYEPGAAAPPVDAMASASPYAKHDVVPRIDGLSATEKRGQDLFQANCAFCHGADGTGKNWIGSFLEPHARDLTDPQALSHLDREGLRQVIRMGLPGTSMPAWKAVLSETDIDAVIAYISRAFQPIPETRAGAPRP